LAFPRARSVSGVVTVVTPGAGFVLRHMYETDLPAVLMVENAAYPYPWTEGIFRDCLRVGYHCLVAEPAPAGLDGLDPTAVLPLVGHAVMSAAVGECHLLNLCVHPDWQGRGLGRRMLLRLFSIGRANNADTAFLEVRASNGRAMALYASEGFCEVGLRRGYYPAGGRREDAVVMARPLL
jgi:[ribosomal protein S18]-alanine N-acetyltransferase